MYVNSKADAQSDNEEMTEPEPDVVLSLEDCMFCSVRSDSLESNLMHMTSTHGFFIPDAEYLVDLQGLVTYLQNKITRYHWCLTCNGKGRSFYSTEAVRGHMTGKGHCFVEYEENGQIELEEFYDFKPSYPG